MANLTGSRSSFPTQIDVFNELTDLSPSKKIQAKRYQELKMKEVLSPAEVSELNSLTTELQDSIVTPEYQNKVLDALINLETFFLNETVGFVNSKQTEMNNYVDTKKTEMQTEINKFSYKGAYSPSTAYVKNNFVDFNDGSSNQTYLCIENCTDKEPSSNPLFWRKMTVQGQKGDRGDAGANFVYKGSWIVTTTYMKDEAVTYGGNLFVSKIDNNLGFEPSISAETSQWVKAMDISIVSVEMIGVRVLSSQSNYINFITDEITTFNASLDSLSVYMNSIRLTKGVDYIINPNNQGINKVSGTWDGTMENPIFFEFAVRKNVNNDIVFKDGTTLQNGSVTRDKLDVDTQAEINKINNIVNSLGSGVLETVAQGVIPAINELNTALDSKANTSDIDDILTAQGILDKVKTVDGSGSGLDADLLDGKHATEFASSTHTHAIATQAQVDEGISNTLYVTPLGLAGLKQSVVNGKQQVVNAINDSIGYSSGLTTNNTHDEYATWIRTKVAPSQSFFSAKSNSAFNSGTFDTNCISSVVANYGSYSISGNVITVQSGSTVEINFQPYVNTIGKPNAIIIKQNVVGDYLRLDLGRVKLIGLSGGGVTSHYEPIGGLPLLNKPFLISYGYTDASTIPSKIVIESGYKTVSFEIYYLVHQ